MSGARASKTMLSVENLSVEYPGIGGTNHAVNGMSFEIDRGEIVGVVGESGSGKSTAMLAVLGLVRSPGRITGGRVRLDDILLSGLSERDWRLIRGERIALVPQNPRGALSPVTPIGNQISDVYRAHRRQAGRSDSWERGVELLTALGINDPARRMHSFPHELSGGMVQRVVIAMGLAREPELLIADEPTSGLDATVQAQVLDDMRKAVAGTGSALLIITQDLAIVANYCARVYMMHAGEVIESAPTAKLFAAPASPASLALIAAQRNIAPNPIRLKGFAAAGQNVPAACLLEPRCPFSDQRAMCRSTHPALVKIGDGHQVRCHRHETVQMAARAVLDDELRDTQPHHPAPMTPERPPANETASLPALLEVHGLGKTFPIPRTDKVIYACNDITLSVLRGATLGVIGESGSGKTTLGRCLLRLLEPTSGRVYFDGVDLAELSRRDMRARRADLQVVFQEPSDSMDPLMTIGRQVTEPLRIHRKLGRRQRWGRALELLALVGLNPSFADALPAQLPLGALQRASIARAIASGPTLLVLDEPTSALPPEAEAEIVALLKKLQRQLGLTYIFISHDLSLVRSFCDHVIVMYLGEVVESGRTVQVLGSPAHPYTQALLTSVLASRPGLSRDRTSRLQGEIPSPIDLPPGCYLASRCPHAVGRCRTEAQRLVEMADDEGHEVRCWRSGELEMYDRSSAKIQAARESKSF
jgi:peptide/nickel transport system ATP-binding protein